MNHASISSTCLTASAVITTSSKAIRLTGRYQSHRVRQPWCRLRAAKQVLVQLTGDDQQYLSRAMSFSFCASSLVSALLQRTSRQRSDDPDVPSSARMLLSARRGTSLVNFLTVVLRRAAKVTPPERQIGLLIEPERARPVPFWRHGFTETSYYFSTSLLSTSTLTSTSCTSNNNPRNPALR